MSEPVRIRDARLMELAHVTLGDAVRDDVPAGTFLLPVQNAGDFRKDQKVRVSGYEDEYTVTDPDCRGERISIDPALAHPAEAGDPVIVWDKRAQRASKVPRGQVALDDEDGGDTVTVDVAHGLKHLKPGVRDGDGEPVRLLDDGESLLLFDAPGAEDLDSPGDGGASGPAGARLVFSSEEITRTGVTGVQPVTPLDEGVIKAVYTTVSSVINPSQPPKFRLHVNDAAVGEWIEMGTNATGLSHALVAGDELLLEVSDDAVGTQGLTVVCMVVPQ